MEKNNKKIIAVAYIFAAVIAAISASVIFETMAAAWGFVARLYGQDIFRHGVPVTAALLVLTYLLVSRKANTVSDEVITETRKVVWPSRKDTTAMTIVACIMVVISSLIIFVMDFLSQEIVKVILGT